MHALSKHIRKRNYTLSCEVHVMSNFIQTTNQHVMKAHPSEYNAPCEYFSIFWIFKQRRFIIHSTDIPFWSILLRTSTKKMKHVSNITALRIRVKTPDYCEALLFYESLSTLFCSTTHEICKKNETDFKYIATYVFWKQICKVFTYFRPGQQKTNGCH